MKTGSSSEGEAPAAGRATPTTGISGSESGGPASGSGVCSETSGALKKPVGRMRHEGSKAKGLGEGIREFKKSVTDEEKSEASSKSETDSETK